MLSQRARVHRSRHLYVSWPPVRGSQALFILEVDTRGCSLGADAGTAGRVLLGAFAGGGGALWAFSVTVSHCLSPWVLLTPVLGPFYRRRG